MRVTPKKMVWKFRWFIHNIFIHLGPFSSAMKNMSIICKSCFSSKSRVAQPLKKYLEGTMNMKQDRRLNNGLLMHVNNLIMNDPDTVKVTSKQTVTSYTSTPKTFWEIWVEVYAWLGVRWTTGRLRLQKAPMPLNWVLRIICIRKGKTQKVKIFLVVKVYLVKSRYREDHEINGVV